MSIGLMAFFQVRCKIPVNSALEQVFRGQFRLDYLALMVLIRYAVINGVPERGGGKMYAFVLGGWV
jgi:hypothetical protein